MLGRTDSRTRLLLLLVIFIVASVALMGRLAYWQILQRDDLAAKAVAQTTVRLEEPTRRGEIYDRSGTVVLATTVERDRLVAATDKLTDEQRRATGDELVRILALDPDGAAALRDRLASGKAYVILAREIEPAVADAIRAASAARTIVGITLEPEPIRVYPQSGGSPDSTLAAHLMGFVNRDGKGQYGVEQAYQDALAGDPRIVLADRDANGRTLLDQAQVEDPGVPGQDVRLTIDAGLQLAVEQELLAAWVADKAKSVSAVVMDPYTGEIYAEATVPAYDANEYRAIAAAAPERFIDPVVSNVYEPGSVFKMMTATAALETGNVTSRPGSRTSARCGSTRAGPRSTTLTARAWAGCRSRTPSRSRATSSRQRSRWVSEFDPGVVRDPLRRWLSSATAPDRHRCRRRGRPASCATRRISAVAPDRPRQRRLRAGRGGHTDPARHGVRGDGERRRRSSSPTSSRRSGPTTIASSAGAAGHRHHRSRSRSGLMNHVVDDGAVLQGPHARARL